MISIYIALRFEWKYAVPVLIALMHDILITAGVYALVGREVTTSTVAALLTIVGFSLYDTIIVFDRIRENVPRMPSAAFSQIVNRSMSEVIVRSMATSFCTILPVLALFFFGGDTLKDFAFALIVGTISGAYSSVFIAAPVLTHWKDREPVYRTRERRIRAELGYLPAYAVATGGGPVDVAPAEPRGGRRSITAPQDPTQVSKSEFDAMVRDLGIEEERQPASTGATRGRPAGGRRARANGGTARPPAGARRRHAEAGASERRRRAAEAQEAAQPQAREASLMAMLVWAMMGLALWHFTIFLPDRFWGGIVGAFLGALFGAILIGLIVNGFTVPGQDDTTSPPRSRRSPARSPGSRSSTSSASARATKRDLAGLAAQAARARTRARCGSRAARRRRAERLVAVAGDGHRDLRRAGTRPARAGSRRGRRSGPGRSRSPRPPPRVRARARRSLPGGARGARRSAAAD